MVSERHNYCCLEWDRQHNTELGTFHSSTAQKLGSASKLSAILRLLCYRKISFAVLVTKGLGKVPLLPERPSTYLSFRIRKL